jgi:hypothetical protein
LEILKDLTQTAQRKRRRKIEARYRRSAEKGEERSFAALRMTALIVRSAEESQEYRQDCLCYR